MYLGATGLTPTAKLSKNGSGFVASLHAVSEISDNWYLLPINASEVSDLGELAIQLDMGTPDNFLDNVVPDFPSTDVDANVITVDANAIDKDSFASNACEGLFSKGALPEAYAADGAAATPAQLLYMLWSALTEFAISGATLTCKKLDGTTTSMAFTLSPAGNPTARFRQS